MTRGAAAVHPNLVPFLKSILEYRIRIDFCFPGSGWASGIDSGGLWQSDAAFRNRLECAGGHSEPFSAACEREASRAFRFRRLFPLSQIMKGGIPYTGTLVLSLASKKELKIPLSHLD